MYAWAEIQDRLAEDGSIYTFKAIHPSEIADQELGFYWGKARDALVAFERMEDEVVRILDHRYSRQGSRG